jgi:DNA-binding LacI/PurR family transcriptional regulator
MRLDPASELGIAGQIRARIALLIADGELRPGARLPPLRGLADQLGTNVNTVRAAYARLEADGLVSTRQGVGTVVVAASTDRLARSSPRLISNTVIVLTAGWDPFYVSLLQGIDEVAAEEGTLVLVADSRDSSELASAIIRRVVARGVDGIIAVSAGGFDDRTTERRTDTSIPPIVHVDQPHRRGYSLVFNGDQAGYRAARHLGEHGHRAIGFVTAPLSWPNVGDLHRGYRRALEEIGARPLVSEMEEFSLEAGRAGVARLLDAPDPPSAVFAASESLAFGVIREAQARGLDVPGDLAIVTYGESSAGGLVDPPLTAVSVPAREAGAQAMRTLHALIAGRRPSPQRVVLDTELVVRASCGPHSPAGDQ